MKIQSLLLAAPLAAVLLAQCGTGAQELVNLAASSDDLSVAPIMGPSGKLTPKMIKGVYGKHCKTNAGKNWDLRLNDPSDKSVEIVKNDTIANCPLTLTAIQMQSGGFITDYTVDPPIVLNLGYVETPSRVNTPPPSRLAFYANARLNGLAEGVYTNSFGIHLIYSDDALVCGATAPNAIYAKVTATATGSSVSPPEYNMGFDSLQLVVDADKVVQDTSSGNIVLRLGKAAQSGEEWKVFDEASTCCQFYSFAEIDAMYKGAALAQGEMAGALDVSIPWEKLGLLGQRLARWRTVIVKHTGEGGVYSYELFQIMFPGPHS